MLIPSLRSTAPIMDTYNLKAIHLGAYANIRKYIMFLVFEYNISYITTLCNRILAVWLRAVQLI